MQQNAEPSTLVVLPDAVEPIDAFGDRVRFLLTGKQTGGQFTLFMLECPPGSGPPIHLHEREDETFLPLEGRVEFYKDGQWLEVPVGTTVHSPRGVVHAFRNPGDTTLRMLIQTTPSGFEDFFARCAAIFHEGGERMIPNLVDASAEFGIYYTELGKAEPIPA